MKFAFALLQRLNDSNRNSPTNFVNLKTNPAKPSESMGVAADILSGKIGGVKWPRAKVEAKDWTPVKFLSRFLTETAVRWFADNGLGCIPLGEVAEMGPVGRRTQDVYLRGEIADADEHGRWGLWYNNQSIPSSTGVPIKQTMRLEPDCSLLRQENNPEKNLGDLADSYWEQRGRLLLPMRLPTPSMRMSAVWLEQAVLGRTGPPS